MKERMDGRMDGWLIMRYLCGWLRPLVGVDVLSGRHGYYEWE